MVLPNRIELLVTPTSVWAAGVADPPQAARVTMKAATAAIRAPILVIELPPAFMEMYLNSLRILWYLSTLTIRDPPQAPPEPCIGCPGQADDSVGGKDHGQDQDRPVGDRRARLLDGRGDRGRDPRLGRYPLVRLDREEVGEDPADERPGDGRQATDDSAHEELDREGDWKAVRAHEPGRQAEERTGYARVKGRDAEGERLVAGEVDSRRGGRDLAVADRTHRSTGSMTEQVPGQPEKQEGPGESHVIDPLVRAHRCAGHG